jgi:hypothetical protein
MMDRFFDIWNTPLVDRSLSETRPQKLKFGKNMAAQMSILKDTGEMVRAMRKLGDKDPNKVLPRQALLYFQQGILRNIAALPLLHADMKLKFPGEDVDIPTVQLNQDLLESFFSVIRSYGGTNTSPNALEFKFRLRKYLAQKNPDLILQGKGNVLADETNNLTGEVCILEFFYRAPKYIINSI